MQLSKNANAEIASGYENMHIKEVEVIVEQTGASKTQHACTLSFWAPEVWKPL